MARNIHAKRANKRNPREDRNNENSKWHKNRQNKKDANSTQVSQDLSPKKKTVELVPRTIRQEDLLYSLENSDTHIVIVSGPAGAGKTFMSTSWAIKQLKEGKIKKIVMTRPNVAVDDKDIGYLPGDILGKMAPWLKPITDVMSEYFSKSEIESMIKEEVIEIVPIAFMRGRSFNNCVILVDEAQGTTANSLLAILTRIGIGSKLIITGDTKQSDRGNSNGLSDLILKLEKFQVRGLDHIKFERNDVQRHPIIKDILKMYGQSDY